MKISVIILFLSLILLSCHSNEIQFEQLIGSWKMRDVINDTGEDISDKTTFNNDSTFIAEIFLDGNVVESFSGKFKIDQNKKTISIQFEDYIGESKIEKLNEKEFIVKDLKTGKITRSIRY